jgi:hypothetical protein
MKKIINEHPVKTYARKMLREGEMENAEVVLACKDQVDRLADVVEEVGKMVNDELPKLIEKIRATLGPEQADVYQQTANSVLSELLEIVKEKKATLEQAVLVLTGDAQAEPNKTELNLPDEGGEDITGDEETDFAPEAGTEKVPAPLGRSPRLPAEESRKFNKKLSEAKIVALKEALDETDTKKFPNRARRLAEELRRVATIAIKEESKLFNAKKSSKDMMKPVSEAKNKKKSEVKVDKKKPAFLVKAEKKAETKEKQKLQSQKIRLKFQNQKKK